MEKLFFKKAKCMLVGAKPHNRSALKKMISEYGCDIKQMQTFVDIQEALDGAGKKKFNLLLFDDDCKDIDLFESLVDSFISRLKDVDNSLFIFIAHNQESKYLDLCHQLPNFLVLPKPYTIGSFNAVIDNFIDQKEKAEQQERSIRKKESRLIIKAGKSYQAFRHFIEEIADKDSEDEFLKTCKAFLKSLETGTKVDYQSLAKVLSVGVASKRYEDLDLFVEAWLDSLPVDADYIPDISRVILFNKNFELFKKLENEDKFASLAIGAGMVISASVLVSKKENEETVLEFIEKGVKLAGYKQAILDKAKSILAKIVSQEKATSMLKSYLETG